MNFNFGQPMTPKTTASNPQNPGNTQPSMATGFPLLGAQTQSGFTFGTSTPTTIAKPGPTTSSSTGAPTLFTMTPNPPSSGPVPSSFVNTQFSAKFGATTPASPDNQFKPGSLTAALQSMQSKPASSSPGGTLSFKPPTTAPATPQLTKPTTMAPGSLTFGGVSTSSAPGLNLGIGTTASGTLTFGAPTATTSAGLNFGMSKTTAPVPSTTFAPLSTSAPTIAATSTPSSTGLTLPASTTVASLSTALAKPATTAAPATPQTQAMSFQELEELILNKWTAELVEQEKVFLNQANQINTWDKIINDNTEKLKQLHTTMEKVKKQQTKINDDLEVISAQQKDLETCLVPMEKENFPLPPHKTDPNRKNLYMNATNIDSQIKRMSEDLKETIEQINETSRLHDTEDPVIQIGRILNAHMESLRWIDEHTSKMQGYLDSLLKVHDNLRRECDIINKIEGY